MAPKKQNTTPRSKPAAAQDATSALIDCGLADLDENAVTIECNRADAAYLQGNHAEALRLVNDLVSKCENTPHSAWVHHLCGGLCFKVASVTDDPDAKLRHTKDAVSQAKKAAGLSPRKLDYALLYAEMLSNLGNDEEAVEECERALSIENPECPEDIVEDIRSAFRLRIQESNIAIISRWMNGEESQGRRALVDPIELRLLEVLDKKPDSMMLEIVTRIAASRQDMEEQSMPEASQPTNMAEEQRKETEASQQGNMATISEEERKEIEERLTAEASQQRNPVKSQSKSGKGTKAAFPEMPDWVISYWDSLSSEGKKDLLTIKVSDLKKHLSSSKDCTLNEVLEEAISFEECFHNSWKFWSCGGCNKKFGTSDLLIHHAQEEHWASKWGDTERRAVPANVDGYLRFSSWEPLDLNAATKMLEEIPKSGDDNSLFDWPLSNDPERKELLLKIYSFFKALGERGCLSAFIVERVTKFAVDELKGFACGSVAEQEVNQTPVCIRFLGAPELKRIKIFLEQAHLPLTVTAYTYESYLDDFDGAVEGIEIIEKIRLGEDGSLLVIDEQSLLPCKIDDVSCAPNASHVVFDNGVILDSDVLLSWIYTGAPSPLSVQLALWKRAMTLNTGRQGLFKILTDESEYLLLSCLKRSGILTNVEALMAVEDLCLEEGKKKDRQDYEKFLEEMCEEQDISTTQDNVMMKVLSTAKSIKSGEISFEQAYYGGITSHPQDCWRNKAHLHEADSYVEAAIQKLKDYFDTKLSATDVELMRVSVAIEKIQDKMAACSSHDFRSILLPFIKSFIKAQVEDVAIIEATKKSDALAEELIAEESKKPEKKKGKKKK